MGHISPPAALPPEDLPKPRGAVAAARTTVLIVDDDPMNRFLMCEALAQDGYELIEAGSGEEALHCVATATPNLILLDIEMPGMNGLAVCRAIRARSNGKLVPIMMVTGLDDTGSVNEAFDCGATDFFAKPLNWALMRQRVRFILRHNSITQQLARNEQVLDQVQSIVRVGHWEWDLRSGVATMSPQYREMFPHLPAQISGLYLDINAETNVGSVMVPEVRRAVARRERYFVSEASINRGDLGPIRLLTRAQIDYDGDEPIHVLGSSQDVTERHLSEERYASIFHNSPVGIVEVDFSALWPLADQAKNINLDGSGALRRQVAALVQDVLRVEGGLRMNATAEHILGIVPGTDGSVALRHFAQDCALAILKALHDNGSDAIVQKEMPLADGSSRYLALRMPAPRSRDGYKRLLISITDVTELVWREQRLRSADKIIENSSDGVAVIGKDKRAYLINPAFERITGYTIDQLRNNPPFTLVAKSAAFKQQLPGIDQQLEQHGVWRGEAEFIHRDGQLIPVLLNLSVIRDDNGEISGYVAVVTDVTYLKDSERRLFHLAHFDTLTKLPNRLSLQERLEREFHSPGIASAKFSLLYIDLDGFKLVNDTMGHSTGDNLLGEVATRLQNASQSSDLLGRIGGDEFALLMEGGPSREQIVAQANRLLAALEAPFQIQGREIFIGASIGACTYPDHAGNASDMLRNADTAMYQAKRLGRSQLCFYSDDLTTESSRRLGIESELRTAIASDQLFLVYQPKYDADNGRMVGAEALVRWLSPTRGVVPPGDFIGIAEESGLIIPLGEWVIRDACRQLAQWRDEFGFALPVAINISALHLRQHSLLDVIGEAIARHSIDPRLLEIEITEDSLDFRGKDDEDPYAVLNQLSAMGLAIAIDDFGTGYSSLSQLKKMPISTLKIDRSFVRDIATSHSDFAIIAAIVGLAKTLEMQVVAEGVENEEQAERLRNLQCNVFQGFLYSKPLAASDFMALFQQQK